METPKGKYLLEEINFGLEEKEGGDLKRRNGFHLSFSLIFLLFLIFMVVFPHSIS